jgi:transglutaminase-like putative cysteine protease
MIAAPKPSDCLASNTFVDAAHTAVQAFASANQGPGDARARAANLYLAVRDGFRYDPYRLDLSDHGMTASTVLELGYGWCVTKAALLAACARAVGIPARLGYADVKNHLSSEKLRATMGTDVFFWHGYTDLFLPQADGSSKWVKATPAFNLSLCEKAGIFPLEFDGTSDSIYHPFDRAGNRHMEYLADRGRFVDVPLAEMRADFMKHYPQTTTASMQATQTRSDFEADVAREAK